MKKILIGVIFLFFPVFTFANVVPTSSSSFSNSPLNVSSTPDYTKSVSTIAAEEVNKNASTTASAPKSCATSPDKNNLCSPKFEIDVSTFSPGGQKFIGDNISSPGSKFFTTLIENLLIALGVIALLIMSIGAGYMIFYHGQDEYLSKGKSIFMAGIISLIVALSSYYLVNLLRFILYS